MSMRAKYSELEWVKIHKDFEKSGLKLISNFTFNKDKHKFLCLNESCGLEFESNFSGVKNKGYGCVPCRKKARGKDQRLLSEEKLMARKDELRNRGIELLDVYVTSHTKYNWKCLKCDHLWVSLFTNVYNSGTGCSRCAGKSVSNQDIQDRSDKLKTNNIEMLDTYSSAHTKNIFRCLIKDCNHVWKAEAGYVLRGKAGCAKCKGLFVTESDKTKQVNTLLDRDIRLIGFIKGVRRKYEFECLKNTCKFIWITSFVSVYRNGTGCPKCKGRHKTEDEKLKTSMIRGIRNRMNDQYRKGRIPTKTAKSDMSDRLKDYWFEQCKSIPHKPDKGYELDHIIPVSLFDPTDIDQMRDCWNHKNFQWLPMVENRSKSNKLMFQYFTSWHYEVLDKMSISLTV